jgi:hypothetical protein
VSEPRSLIADQRHHEAAQKFDYFIAGLTGALCAYIVQNWKPEKTAHLGPDVLETVALLVLFAAAVAGFKRIEWGIVVLRINGSWLEALERRGALADALQKSQGQLMFNESGDCLSPVDAMQSYKAASEIAPEIQKKLDHAASQAERWYKTRNRLLATGFLVLTTARFLALFW